MNAGGFGLNVLLTAVFVLVVVSALFTAAKDRGRYDVIDVFWGVGFAIISVVTLLIAGPTPRGLLVALLTVVWGVRLGWHIRSRNRGKAEDPRYVAILERRGVLGMYRVYVTQAVVMVLVSLPVQAASYLAAPIGPLDYLAVAVWVVGFVFESVGDWQLSKFRGDPASKGQVMDRGLWRYTRHPNYFGDAVVWWGLFLFATHHWIGLLTVVAPIAMTFTLANGTGKPLLEKGMAERRPGYAEYVERTSGFVPWPPKKAV